VTAVDFLSALKTLFEVLLHSPLYNLLLNITT